MPDTTPPEAKRLAEIEATLAPLKAEKAAILNRVRQRRHYTAKTAATQS